MLEFITTHPCEGKKYLTCIFILEIDKVRLRTSGRARIKFMGDQFTNPTAQTAINITTGFAFLVKLIRRENEEVAAVNDSPCE